MQDYSNEISLRFDRILTLDAIYKFKARAVRFYKKIDSIFTCGRNSINAILNNMKGTGRPGVYLPASELMVID